MFHKSVKRDTTARHSFFCISSSQRVHHRTWLVRHLFSVGPGHTFTRGLKKTISKWRKAKRSSSRTLCRNARRNMSPSLILKSIKLTTLTNSDWNRMKYMQRKCKKITSRWRFRTGLLSRYTRRICIALLRRKLSLQRSNKKKPAALEKCRRLRCKHMGRLLEKTSNPESLRHYVGSCCKERPRPGSERSELEK